MHFPNSPNVLHGIILQQLQQKTWGWKPSLYECRTAESDGCSVAEQCVFVTLSKTHASFLHWLSSRCTGEAVNSKGGVVRSDWRFRLMEMYSKHEVILLHSGQQWQCRFFSLPVTPAELMT
eukprot:scaffold181790_cov18-Tisochrysis_lutea.AAC.1